MCFFMYAYSAAVSYLMQLFTLYVLLFASTTTKIAAPNASMVITIMLLLSLDFGAHSATVSKFEFSPVKSKYF